jgi:predicted metalloprotease with PDZ domain
VAGRPLDDVYRYVTTTDEIEWETHLAPFGLRVDYTYKAPEDAESVIFGIEKGLPNGRMVIGRVDQDSPAAKGGLSVKDEILAVDDYRLTEKNALNILKTRSPKKLATFLVNRDGKIKTLRVKPAKLPYNKVIVEQVENPTDSQRQLFEAWLSTTWD